MIWFEWRYNVRIRPSGAPVGLFIGRSGRRELSTGDDDIFSEGDRQFVVRLPRLYSRQFQNKFLTTASRETGGGVVGGGSRAKSARTESAQQQLRPLLRRRLRQPGPRRHDQNHWSGTPSPAASASASAASSASSQFASSSPPAATSSSSANSSPCASASTSSPSSVAPSSASTASSSAPATSVVFRRRAPIQFWMHQLWRCRSWIYQRKR